MTSNDLDTVRVAFRQEGLEDEQAATVREVLDAAGLLLAGDDGDEVDVAVTGPLVAAVKLLGDRWPIVTLVGSPDRSGVSELLTAGASGVVPLEDAATSLVPAIQAVAAGLVVVPGEARGAASRPVLTSREKQILGLVALGLTNAEIGRRVFLAESTVKYHLLSVYGKLGVRTRKEAADLVLDQRNGLDVGVLGLGSGSGRTRGGGYSEPKVS